MDSRTDHDGSGHRWRKWVIIGVCAAVVAAALGVGLSHILSESPSHASAGTASGQTGTAKATSGQPPFGPDQTGVCQVPIRPYQGNNPNDRKECAGGWGWRGRWLVTIRNASDARVMVSEQYAGHAHGVTTIAPKQTVIMPVYETVFPLSTALVMTACSTDGTAGCVALPHPPSASVHIEGWQHVGSDTFQVFVRDTASIGLSAYHGRSYVALNNSPYNVQLHWSQLGPGNWVTVPPKGHSQTIPPGDVEARKDLGSGEVALVSFTVTAHDRGDDIYRLTTPTEYTGSPPYAIMTFLSGSWCSVQIQNLGPRRVILNSWLIPGTFPFAPEGGPVLVLDPQETGTLRMKPATIVITGIVGDHGTGDFATVKAMNWRKCA
ncbi:MAG TPA: hypothetical protein VNV87_19345 [Acidimicrobiales bacterium]|jgi:hypothetical protein|nr:hypothetical protein [Acidimicrobiales bacterium]